MSIHVEVISLPPPPREAPSSMPAPEDAAENVDSVPAYPARKLVLEDGIYRVTGNDK